MSFVRKHPGFSSFVIAIGSAIGVDVLAFLVVLISILGSAKCGPDESCDGVGLVLYGLFMFSIPAGILLGGIVAAVVYPVLRSRFGNGV